MPLFARKRSTTDPRTNISWPLEKQPVQLSHIRYPPPLPKNPPPPPSPPSNASSPRMPQRPAATYQTQHRNYASHSSQHSDLSFVSRPSTRSSAATTCSTRSRANSALPTSRPSQRKAKFGLESPTVPSAYTANRLSRDFNLDTSLPFQEHFYAHNGTAHPNAPYQHPQIRSNCSVGSQKYPASNKSRDSCCVRSPVSEDDLDLPAHIPASDSPPTGELWEAAGDVVIYDSDGVGRKFRSLYEGDSAIGEQQMIIFVRHFFCSACQGYLQALSSALPLETYFTLPIPSSITIIGLGSPSLIPYYRETTGTPFPIYTDPTKQLYKKLGMGWTLNFGRRVEYTNYTNEWSWMSDQYKQLRDVEGLMGGLKMKEQAKKEAVQRQRQMLARNRIDSLGAPLEETEAARRRTNRDTYSESAFDQHLGFKWKGGNPTWVGGEVLVRGGKCVWLRRMKDYRGHVATKDIKMLLGAEG